MPNCRRKGRICSITNIILDCGFTYHTDNSLRQKLRLKYPNLDEEVESLSWDTFGSSDRYVHHSHSTEFANLLNVQNIEPYGLLGWKKASERMCAFWKNKTLFGRSLETTSRAMFTISKRANSKKLCEKITLVYCFGCLTVYLFT